MEGNKYSNEMCDAGRPQLAYEEQVMRFHSLLNELEQKVSHISASELGAKGVPMQSHPTRLNRDLEEVLNRFETILANIQN